jgi:CheY-like chemotaxis protein
LGLAICKQLVEMMNGNIGVDSIDGGGSSFWFTLAFESALAGALSTPRQQHRGQRRVVTVDGRPARILVAEDNAINRDVALAQLKNLGYEASAVANGAEAIVALQDGDYDLVLMDCEMPVMDGFAATTHIRRSDRANIPIIAITAGAMPADRDRCFREGMNDYLAKPVDLGQLAEALFRNLSGCTERSVALDAAQTVEIAVAQNQDYVFDVNGLLGRLMGDTQLAGVILRSFVREIPCQIERLRERLVERDQAGIRLQVHTLKGAAGTVAAARLYKVAIEMESTSAATLVDHCLEMMPRVIEEFLLFKNAVAQTEWIQIAAENDLQRNTDDYER